MNPSPDTGAGTPPAIYCTGGCDACRDYADEIRVPLVVSSPPARPATDPAGLDVERLRDALKTIRDLCDMDHDEMDAEFGSEQRVRIVVIPAVVDDAIGTRPMSEGLRRVLFRLFSYLGSALPAARLSVADGPGPEERLEWRDHLNAIRRLLVGSPPNADMTDAVIGYALNDCEAAIDVALSRPLPENREEPSR